MLLLGVATRRRRSRAGKVTANHCPTRHGRIQDCPSTMARQLIEAGLEAGRARTSVAGHGAVVKPALERFSARHVAVVQAGWVLLLELPLRRLLP